MKRPSALLLLALAVAMPAAAQPAGPMRMPVMPSIPAPADPGAIPLGTGGVAGGAPAEGWYGSAERATVRNVTRATLTPVLPDPAKATGAAVIVAPGGGFMMLSIGDEGTAVARWLADHGIAAFILKYRLRPTPPDGAEFARMLSARLSETAASASPSVVTPEDAIVDVEAALKLVRARAREWHVDPKRVGLLGFSAGAMAVLGATLRATPATMPAFVAPVYPLMSRVDVPAAAPPLYVALAMDDPLVGGKGYGLVEGWHDARRPAELHVYQSGGHGFGLGRPGTGAAGWIESFRHWLDVNGLLKDGAS